MSPNLREAVRREDQNESYRRPAQAVPQAHLYRCGISCREFRLVHLENVIHTEPSIGSRDLALSLRATSICCGARVTDTDEK